MSGETVPYWNINLGQREIDAVSAAIANRKISQGTLTLELEEQLATLLDVPYVACTTSGTMALMLAFLGIGIQPGDEVIIPNRTFIATAHAARLLGARVRLADVVAGVPAVDPSSVEALLTDKTRAIVAVHLNGRSADMNALTALAARYDIPVVEDACQALLSRRGGRCLGTLSRFGCFSLGMAKLLTSGQGGFVVCHTPEDIAVLRGLRNQGVTDVTKLASYETLAGNFKFTDVQAAIALAQLPRIHERAQHVGEVYRRYRDGLRDAGCLRIIEVDVDGEEVPLRGEFLCTDRERFMARMAERGITVVPQVPDLDASPHLGRQGSFVHSRIYGDHQITLPSGPDQPLENVDRAIRAALEVDKEMTAWEQQDG